MWCADPELKMSNFRFSKYFDISERARVQFRAECFNLFNHANHGRLLQV
jgi:hypothetical protein